MKTGILCRFALLCCVVLSGGCSLLKVSVSEGDPLPRAEVRMRVMTRGFYHDLTAAVARTADSIADAAPDLRTRIGAVRWKMQVSSAAVGAAMQPIPEVALADTWILCRRMEEAFAAAPDSLLFGDLTPQARRTVRSLSERAGALARDVLSRDRYALMREFVDAYAAAHPITGDGAETPNTTLAWLTFLESRGADHTFASGSIAEVIADLGDRVDLSLIHI